jgi:VWFA-related protein
MSAVVVLALTVVSAGQQAPVFRSRVDLVTVDVTVLDRAGRAIETLSPGDFSLKVDGSPRRVLSAEYVPYRTAASSAQPEVSATSNEHVATGRVILMAVDQGNIRRTEGRVALRAAAAFLDTLDSADRVAAVALDDVAAISFTDDHRSVKRALTRLTGRGVRMATEFKLGLAEALAVADGNRSRLDQLVLRECGQPLGRLQNMERLATGDGMRDPCPTHIEQQARMVAHNARSQGAESLDALQRLLRRLEDMDGPKTLVLLSEGLIAEPQRVDLTELAALAQKARVSIYVLQLDSPVADAASDRLSPTLADDFRVRADGLARVAGAGGGALLQLVGADTEPFARILRELSGYYLLAFEVTPADRDGRAHRIGIRVGRSGATVRARPAFRAPPAPTTPVSTEDRLVQLLRAPRLATELPLRLGILKAKADDGAGVQSQITIEAGGVDVDATYAAVIVDTRGVVVTSATQRSTSGRLAFPATLPEGRYLLRAAAIDASGRAGSVEQALDATLHGQAGGLRWSDVALVAPAPHAGAEPTAIVDRTPGPRLRASFEIYTDGVLDGPVRVTVTGTGGNTAARLHTEAEPARTGPGTWTVTTEFDLLGLPPGRYVLTAELPQGHTLTRSFLLLK